MRNDRYKGVNLNRIHRGKVKLRRFTSLSRVREAMRNDRPHWRRAMATKDPPLTAGGRKARLISRLENCKFKQAQLYTDDLSDQLRGVVDALATLWGDTGWARGGAFAVLLDYIVFTLLVEIERHGPAPVETPPAENTG